MLWMLLWKRNRSYPAREQLSGQSILKELGNVEVSLLVDEGNGRQYLLPSGGTKTQRLPYATAGCEPGTETTLAEHPIGLVNHSRGYYDTRQ